MLQPTPLSTAVWPIPGDASDLQQIVWSGMATIANQEVLLHAYQTVLNNAQAVPPATGTGTSSASTALTMTAVVGSIILGAYVNGTGIVLNTVWICWSDQWHDWRQWCLYNKHSDDACRHCSDLYSGRRTLALAAGD
jgi:hypothetical protein